MQVWLREAVGAMQAATDAYTDAVRDGPLAELAPADVLGAMAGAARVQARLAAAVGAMPIPAGLVATGADVRDTYCRAISDQAGSLATQAAAMWRMCAEKADELGLEGGAADECRRESQAERR